MIKLRLLIVLLFVQTIASAQSDFSIQFILDNRNNILPLFGEELEWYFEQRGQGSYSKYDQGLYDKARTSDQNGIEALKGNDWSGALTNFENAMDFYERSKIKKEAYPHSRIVLAFMHAVKLDAKSVKKQVKEITGKSLRDPYSMNYLAGAFALIDEYKDSETYLFETVDLTPEFCLTYENFIYLYQGKLDNPKRVEKFKARKPAKCN